jgi:hypothetical protein
MLIVVTHYSQDNRIKVKNTFKNNQIEYKLTTVLLRISE